MRAGQSQTREPGVLFLIDEINRGDIPRIFGELLTVLEKDKRGKPILLPLTGEKLIVPANVFCGWHNEHSRPIDCTSRCSAA